MRIIVKACNDVCRIGKVCRRYQNICTYSKYCLAAFRSNGRNYSTNSSSTTYAASRVLMHQVETESTILPTGLRVISQYMPGDLASFGAFVDSGSRYEDEECNGVAHFLEHLLFKGTSKRDRIQLEKEIEDCGAHLNAYTAREHTVYHMKALKPNLSRAMEIFSDVLNYSKLENNSIEEERHVILREMKEVGKSVEEVVFDRLHTVAFPQSSLGYTILGQPRNIKAMKREWIRDYINRYYTANRMLIAGAGSFSHKEFVNLVSTYFSKVRPSRVPVDLKPAKFVPRQFFDNVSKIPVTHCAVAFEGSSWTDALQPAFMVLQQLLGSYDRFCPSFPPPSASSNTFLKSLNSSMAYTYSAFNTCYNETGLFGIYFTAPHFAVASVVKQILLAIWNLAYTISPEELRMAKEYLKLNIFEGTTSTTAVFEEIGRQFLTYGRRIHPYEFHDRIDSVSMETIRHLVWAKLHLKPIALSLIGENVQTTKLTLDLLQSYQ